MLRWGGVKSQTSTHTQQHNKPRGAYVACVNDMAIEVDNANGNPTQSNRFNEMISAAQTYNLSYLAFFGVEKVLDGNSAISPIEKALREILKETRNQLPGIKIGVVAGSDQDFSDLITSDVQFEAVPYPTEACEAPQDLNPFNKEELFSLMNPQNPTWGERYRSEILKFINRVFQIYNGGYTAGKQLNSPNKSPNPKDSNHTKLSVPDQPPPPRGDYFDWVSLDHEYWIGEIAARYGNNSLSLEPNDIDKAYSSHKSILDAIQSILSGSEIGCYARVESYENIITTNRPVSYSGQTHYISTPINNQANDITLRVERVLPNHYFWFPRDIDDRFCEAIKAWGQANYAYNTDFWPAFSVERSDKKKTYCSNYSGNNYWGDFLGWFMDPTVPSNTGLPLDPTNDPLNAAPYDVDEVEDLYLNEINQSSWTCNGSSASIENYSPDGFIWFLLHLMDNQNIKKKGNIQASNQGKKDYLNVYPNPASNRLYYTNNRELLAVTNSMGQKMPLAVFNSSLLVKNYPNGLYFLFFNKEESPVKFKVLH